MLYLNKNKPFLKSKMNFVLVLVFTSTTIADLNPRRPLRLQSAQSDVDDERAIFRGFRKFVRRTFLHRRTRKIPKTSYLHSFKVFFAAKPILSVLAAIRKDALAKCAGVCDENL